MKNIIVVLFLLVVSFPSSAILVDAVDDAESKRIANTFHYMCCAAGWDQEGGIRYTAGSGTLVCNNAHNGAWVLTAGHTVYRQSTGDTFNYLRYTFQPNYFNAFPKDTTSYLPDKCINAIHDKVFYNTEQDVALVKLESLVRDATGSLVSPIEMYDGEISDNQVIIFGGSGQTGIPSQASESGTGKRDGFKRCARGLFYFFYPPNPGEGVMRFSRSTSIPGIIGLGDSGGFCAVESEGKILMIGVNIIVSGSGESALSSFEYLGFYNSFDTWMNDIIISNGEAPSAVDNWDMY